MCSYFLHWSFDFFEVSSFHYLPFWVEIKFNIFECTLNKAYCFVQKLSLEVLYIWKSCELLVTLSNFERKFTVLIFKTFSAKSKRENSEFKRWFITLLIAVALKHWLCVEACVAFCTVCGSTENCWRLILIAVVTSW